MRVRFVIPISMYQPQFTITNKILKNIGIFEAAREVIMNAPLVPAWEAKFREEALVRTVHHGTHIEGNELNYTEAAKVVAGQEVVGRDRDIQEVLNFRRVLTFIDRFHDAQAEEKIQIEVESDAEKALITKSQGKVTEDVVLYMHKLTTDKLLADDQSGSFRNIQVVVKNSQTGEITFRPPPAIEVPFQVQAFLEYVSTASSEDVHPALKAGIVHYELVRIHPFLDGNGRVARSVATLVLFLEGYDTKKFFALEEFYDRDPMHYYEALQSVEKEQGNLTVWLEYFTEGLAIELTRVKEKVLSLSRDVKLKEDLGGQQMFLTPRQLKIVEFIQQAGFLQNRAFFELFPMVSEDTVLRELKDLLDKGIIKKEGVTKGARYVLRS